MTDFVTVNIGRNAESGQNCRGRSATCWGTFAIMYAVVNRLRLKTPIPSDVWERAQDVVPAQAREVPGFRSLHVIEMPGDEVVLVVVADSAETLDRIAERVGNTWMRENVLPHLAEPPDRQVGKIVATSES